MERSGMGRNGVDGSDRRRGESQERSTGKIREEGREMSKVEKEGNEL
jgi:hypothetical protein